MSVARLIGIAFMAILIVDHRPVLAQQAAPPPATDSGVIRVKSAYGMDDTLVRIKQDIAAKGLRFFDEIDQAQLAAAAGIKLQPSVLLMFGNPPLGIQFLTASPYAGLDWPVRLLVFEDATGQVWIAYTDFVFIANRHHISDRSAQFKMASEVAASIAASAQPKPTSPPQRP
jgi:uncharacterized protein (DUF302 family)